LDVPTRSSKEEPTVHATNRILSTTIRRRAAALGVVTLVGLIAGVTMAFGGSQGDQGGPAYALVNPNGGSPQLVAGHTSGFIGVSVGPFGQGDYCLTPAPGVNVTTPAAVASEEAFYSDVAGFVTVRYPTSGPSCPAHQLEVKTFDQNVDLTNQIAFTVNVP
jgi:hypothetical protein